jgi:hypothetical protein
VPISVPPTGILDALRAALETFGAAVDEERSKAVEAARGISPEARFPAGADVAAIQERFAAPFLTFARAWLRTERPDPRASGRGPAREALAATAVAIIDQCVPGIIERVLPAGWRYILHARLRWLREEMRLALEGEIEALLIGYAEATTALGEQLQQPTITERAEAGGLPPVVPRRSPRAPKTETAARIAAFRERVYEDPKIGTRIRLEDIAIVAGYSLSALMQYQREDPILSATARTDFNGVLSKTPQEFVALLKHRGASPIRPTSQS